MWTQLGISLCCYASTFALCHAVRLFLRATLPRASYQYAVEFVDTFNMICCMYENGMVLKIGLWPFATMLFSLNIIYAFLLEGFANPAIVLDYILRRKVEVSSGVIRVLIELLAGVAAYRYTSFMWETFAPSPWHLHAATFDMIEENCHTSLNVSPFLGFAVELTSVAFLKIVAGYLRGGRKFWRVINAVISVTVILCGLNYTGALMNPILGFAAGWGCQDDRLPSHLLVFWLGPLLGIGVGDWVVENYISKSRAHYGDSTKNGVVPQQNGYHAKTN